MSALVGNAYRGAPVGVNVAASQTLAVLTERDKTFIHGILIQPETVDPGNVIVYDGNAAGKVIKYTFPGGVASLTELKPFYVPLGITSIAESGKGWYVTTGANVNVIAYVQVR